MFRHFRARESGTYRMWVSWRPKSMALVESKDGIHWSEPPQIVLGPRQESGWEDDINRPVVVKRDDGYHLWYTGQAKGRSWIGYATSPDGITWKRMSDKPVLSPEQPWEKVAVMCPHVIWDEQRQAIPHVVFRRRTERAERHRLCHQPGWPDLDEARSQSGLCTRPEKRVGEAQGDRLPGGEARRLVRDVLHRLSR